MIYIILFIYLSVIIIYVYVYIYYTSDISTSTFAKGISDRHRLVAGEDTALDLGLAALARSSWHSVRL